LGSFLPGWRAGSPATFGATRWASEPERYTWLWRSGRRPRPREGPRPPRIVRHHSRDLNSFLARHRGRGHATAGAPGARQERSS
jgi:hypothetical protein